MQLPGGLWENGRAMRDFAFKPPDGAMELTVAEARLAGSHLPAQVSAVLEASLSVLGSGPVTRERVAALCIADRQFLMRQLAALLGRDQVWQSARCDSCGAVYDFHITQTQLPVSAAGPGFPFTTLRLHGSEYQLRVPNGADQEAVAAERDEGRARQMLAWHCLIATGADKPEPMSLDEETLGAMEAALEAITPEAAVMVQTACPECGHREQVYVDPYLVLEVTATELYDEIHTLASTYCWDEATILALPRVRRHRYLALIDRARGMTA